MATKTLNKPNSWQKQVNPNTRAMKQLMKDVRGNVVRLTRNSKDLDEWLEKLAPYTASNCFITGAHADQVKDIVQQISGVVNQTSLPSGSNAEIVKGTMAEACMTMVTNVGEDIKTELQRIAVESYNNRLAPAETAKVIGEKIDSLSKTRCQAIARTETCRAANIANYLNAKEMGAKSYSVICNEGACEYCIEEYGEDMDTIYDINDTESLPPFHPNCRCTPVWSMDPPPEDESSDTAIDEITEEISELIDEIADNDNEKEELTAHISEFISENQNSEIEELHLLGYDGKSYNNSGEGGAVEMPKECKIIGMSDGFMIGIHNHPDATCFQSLSDFQSLAKFNVKYCVTYGMDGIMIVKNNNDIPAIALESKVTRAYKNYDNAADGRYESECFEEMDRLEDLWVDASLAHNTELEEKYLKELDNLYDNWYKENMRKEVDFLNEELTGTNVSVHYIKLN